MTTTGTCPTCGATNQADDLIRVRDTPDGLDVEHIYCADPWHTVPANQMVRTPRVLTTRPWEGVNTPTLEVMAENMRRIMATPERTSAFDRHARAARDTSHKRGVIALAEIEAELSRRETDEHR